MLQKSLLAERLLDSIFSKDTAITLSELNKPHLDPRYK
jgi:hypothetical protein